MPWILMMSGIVFFVKAKCDLKMLPPAHYALALHIKVPDYQARK